MYKKAEVETGLSQDEWYHLRSTVKQAAQYICYRCDEKKKSGDLSVHHIIPRNEDGSNDRTNLVCLCHPCHDYVEMNDLKSRSEIAGSYDDNLMPEIIPLGTLPQWDDETFERPGWHKHVYGGMKRI